MCMQVKAFFSRVVGQMILFIALTFGLGSTFILYGLPRIFPCLTPDNYAAWIQALGVVIAMFFSAASVWWTSELATESKRDTVLALVKAVAYKSDEIYKIISANSAKGHATVYHAISNIYDASVYDAYLGALDKTLEKTLPITNEGVDALLGFRAQCFFFSRSVEKCINGPYKDPVLSVPIDDYKDMPKEKKQAVIDSNYALAKNVKVHLDAMQKHQTILAKARF